MPCERLPDRLKTRERLVKKSDSDVPVFVLCGGLGTRLREETEVRPKPMVPVGNHPDPLAHHADLCRITVFAVSSSVWVTRPRSSSLTSSIMRP